MRLVDLSIDDLALYEAFYCDARMMTHLGGPWAKDLMPAKLQRDVESIQRGTAWIFKVLPIDQSAEAVGTVCIWEHLMDGEKISEIGWTVLPAFQQQGWATRAVAAILDRAKSDGRWGDRIHAYPGFANTASNAICRKLGFELVEESHLEWNGRTLHCNHWVVELSR
jgi:RimJ/RimL family protein N-acetyltransferase